MSEILSRIPEGEYQGSDYELWFYKYLLFKFKYKFFL